MNHAQCLVCLAFAASMALGPPLSAAQPPSAASAGEKSRSSVEGILVAIPNEVVPESYVDDSKWGRTKYQTIGLSVERDGLKLEIRRRKKQVNHGLWKLYRIDLSKADQWEISLSEPRDLGEGRVGFDATIATPLKVLARASQWERDVQLFSVSAQADARVRLKVSCEVRLRLIASRLPPDIRLEPKVTAAELQIESFRLNRISQLHGPLVRELGEEAHDVLQREVNKRREKLAAKINRQIEKKRDQLTLSLADLSDSRWSVLARLVVPSAGEPIDADDDRCVDGLGAPLRSDPSHPAT